MSLELQSFGSDLQLALGHLGVVTIDTKGVVSLLIPAAGAAGKARTFTFLEPLETIRSSIMIDLITWRSRWPDQSRESASLAAFSLQVQEAIKTADERQTILRLTPAGVVADV